MNDDVARRRPAEVTATWSAPAPAVRRTVAIVDRNRAKVLRSAGEMVRQGRAESVGQLQLLSEGPHAGSYAVRVVLLNQAPAAQPPRRAGWLIPVAWVVASLAALVAAVAWLLSALSAASLAGMCVVLLAVLGVAVAAGRKPRGGNVTIISNINVGR